MYSSSLRSEINSMLAIVASFSNVERQIFTKRLNLFGFQLEILNPFYSFVSLRFFSYKIMWSLSFYHLHAMLSASKILALVGRICTGLDIETRLGRDLEIGPGGIVDPFVRSIQLGRQHPADYGHALGGIGPKVIFSRSNDPNAELATAPFAGKGLDLGVKIRIVLDWHGLDF